MYRKYPIPQIGNQFGLWTVLYVPRLYTKVLCECQCLKIAEVAWVHMNTGGSLGCLQCRSPKTHGQCADYKRSQVYSVWQSMIQRCHNPRDKQWRHYGGRGITVCNEWRQSIQTFLCDMGPRPPGSSIERIDNSQGY